MKHERQAWGAAGVLLAALALGACSKPGDPGSRDVRPVPGATGDTSAGATPQPGSGLNGGLGSGMTGSFPATSTATSSTGSGASTGALGNGSGSGSGGGSTNSTPGKAVGERP